MKILCDKHSLSTAISNVSLSVSPKSSLPALEGILIRASGDSISLSGYDLEMGISTSVPAKVLEEGEVVLSAKLFADIIRRMPGEQISVSCDKKMLTELKCGVTEYTILGLPASEFPELPALSNSLNIAVPQRILASMLTQTLFAIATSDTKPVHTGSFFDIEENCMTIVSVDGFRLALRREPIHNDQKMTFIVPGKALSDILRLLSDQDEAVNIQVSKKHILFEIGDYTVISRLLEGDFLNYKTAIPTGEETAVEIQSREVMDAIERTSLLISDRIKSPLRIKFGESLIQMSCSTTIGKAYDEVSCKTTGPIVEMGFNNRYLIDALKASGCDKVKLAINGALSPMKMQPLEGDSFLFLVLPVRLKNEG